MLERVRQEFVDVFEKIMIRLPSVAAALVSFLLFLVIANYLKSVVFRVVLGRTGDATTATVFRRAVQFATLFIGFLVACGIALPGFTVDSLIATFGLTSIAVGFAFKDILENFIAGLFILLSRPFSIGDLVRAQGVVGRVEEIGIRSISLRKLDGELVLIPAVKVFSDVVTVVTNQANRRYELKVPVALGSDVEKLTRLVSELATAVDGVSSEPAPSVIGAGFGTSSIDLTVYYWVNTAEFDNMEVGTRLIDAIRRRFSDEGVEIPYPTQTMLVRERQPSE